MKHFFAAITTCLDFLSKVYENFCAIPELVGWGLGTSVG